MAKSIYTLASNFEAKIKGIVKEAKAVVAEVPSYGNVAGTADLYMAAKNIISASESALMRCKDAQKR